MTTLALLAARPPFAWRSVSIGAVSATGLVGVYLLVVTIAQGTEHAFELFAADAPFVLVIAAGFGVQLALFTELRAVHARHRSTAAVTAAGTGTSAAAMLACCAHHLVDILPILGLSGAAVFLNVYKTPLLGLGIVMSLAGIAFLVRQLRDARRSCEAHPAGVAAAEAGPHDPAAPPNSHDSLSCH